MEEKSNETKPCLVQTSQGFTVSYKEKLLYSKYNPSKAINQIIQNTQILPQTIILCVSPVLSYGLRELEQKLPEDCIMLGLEYEDELNSFIHSNNSTNGQTSNFDGIKNFSFLTKEEIINLGPLLTRKNATLKSGFTLPQPGTFRRVIRIDFSAGTQFNSVLYDNVLENAVNAIMTFWANRVTLVKFGRKYCTNFFKNLSCLDQTVPVQKFFGTVEKPIIVFGAGESAEQGIKEIKAQPDGASAFFILCADTALQPLVSCGIIPDGVFIEEAQNIITRCFIGMQNCHTRIFAGLSSIHSITRFFKREQISFFTTEFTQACFIDRFEKAGMLPPKNEPFGSVGITAFYYAHIFRKDPSVPIKTYGLDFAYSAGRTHTKGTMADNERFQNSNRMKTDANYGAAFNEPAFKKNEKMFTTPIMERYAKLMEELVYKRDCRAPFESLRGRDNDNIIPYLKKERESLLELKSLLTGAKQLPAEELQKEITRLVQEREYLYLHFPDGHKFQYSQSFLNRVRVEVDYYLKIM